MGSYTHQIFTGFVTIKMEDSYRTIFGRQHRRGVEGWRNKIAFIAQRRLPFPLIFIFFEKKPINILFKSAVGRWYLFFEGKFI